MMNSGGSVRKLRVWPGAGGLELFRLQLQGALGMDVAADEVTFVVEVPGSGEPLRLPGLDSYGVASYCAAIRAAMEEAHAGSAGVGYSETRGLGACAHVPAAGPVSCSGAAAASGGPPPSDSGGSSSACGEDDWIELLCAVADMLEGSEDAPQPPTPAHQRPTAAADGHLAVWACVTPHPKPAHPMAASPAVKPLRSSLALAQASPLLFSPVRARGSPAASPLLPVAALAGGGSEAGSDRLPLVNPRLRLKAPRRASRASCCASPCLWTVGEPGSAQFSVESAGWASVLGDGLTPAAGGGRGSVDGYW
ncbi:hypothetical protein HYH03_013963 [Edaphochlamys debaryana]|uniref:Uncharacterized protein n=1 Tax=Edaphochlamys debaryana TaxID=47281 RepID=A0A835XPM6_9CHLO|nr:hypothetical protein HYH03_013963 [Edaphochlamys debaryana]|eukprot:KAG2487394.1 hypothetical protein HYH03_013963 [Edaphochlamys debaryana]